jgi:hypothetical protein
MIAIMQYDTAVLLMTVKSVPQLLGRKLTTEIHHPKAPPSARHSLFDSTFMGKVSGDLFLSPLDASTLAKATYST